MLRVSRVSNIVVIARNFREKFVCVLICSYNRVLSVSRVSNTVVVARNFRENLVFY